MASYMIETIYIDGEIGFSGEGAQRLPATKGLCPMEKG